MNSLLSFFESLFCGRHKTENARLVREILQLQVDLDQASLDLERFAGEISDLEYMVEAHRMEGARLRDEKLLLESKVATLEKWLDESIQIPNIEHFIDKDELIVYAPWTHPEVWRNYEMSTADLVYYALPQELWDQILPRIQAVVEKTLVSWKPENRDCDDWALAMQSFVMISFARLWPKVSLQAAFLTTWSKTHAYNAYVTTDNVIHIYEPQTGQTVGELDVTGAPYDTVKIWYPGASDGKDTTPNVDGP